MLCLPDILSSFDRRHASQIVVVDDEEENLLKAARFFQENTPGINTSFIHIGGLQYVANQSHPNGREHLPMADFFTAPSFASLLDFRKKQFFHVPGRSTFWLLDLNGVLVDKDRYLENRIDRIVDLDTMNSY